MFSVGLYFIPWKEQFNMVTEDVTVSPVWICLFSLPSEYLDLNTLTDIGNTPGEFVKVSKQTKSHQYTSFSRICVYLDLLKELPKAIFLHWEDEEWLQLIDYEQLPFRCRFCHEYGQPGRNHPKMAKQASIPDQW